MKKPLAKISLILLVCGFWLSACGGGGSDSSQSKAPNIPPNVNAGSDQTVDEQSVVRLSGSASDPDGSISSTVWTQVSGAGVTLVNSNSLSVSFTSPTITAQENLTFSLTVRDNSGASASDEVTIAVNPVNADPTADAGDDYGLYEQDTGKLIGAGIDADGSIAEYNWQQISGPAVIIATPDAQNTDFEAPAVTSMTNLEFSLTITDNESAQASDQIVITIHPLVEMSGPLFVDSLLKGAYKVTSDLSVAPGTTLTISPGTTLKFYEQTGLIVAGTLIANGTEAEPIYLTEISSSATWPGIEFRDSSNSSISYAVVEKANFALQLNGDSVVPLMQNVFRDNITVVTDINVYQPMQVSQNTFAENNAVFSQIRVLGGSSFSKNAFVDNPSIFESGYYFDSTTVDQNSFEGASLVIRAPAIGFGYGNVFAASNWWGTTDADEIAALIVDIYDDVALQEIVFLPVLEAAPAKAGSALAKDLAVPRPDPMAGGTPVPVVGPPSQAPDTLTASDVSQALLLSWVNYKSYQYTEIWRSTVDSLDTAVYLSSTAGTKYVDYVGANAAYYYWVRAIGTNGATSTFNAIAGTLGTTGINPG